MSGGPPKILFISHDAGRTGAPIGLLAFMQWLSRTSDYQLGTLLRVTGPLEASFGELGPLLTLNRSILARSHLGRRVNRLLPASLRDQTAAIRRMFQRGGYDLVYSNTVTNGALLEALAPLKVPVITHVHELAYWIERAGPDNFRRVRTHTTHYIAASGAVRDHLVRQHDIPADKITVVHEHIRELPAVPTVDRRVSARERLGLPSGAVVVGACGAEHWRKGRDLIPQLLIALRRQSPGIEFHFLWVGRNGTPEEESALHHDLAAAGLTGNFHASGEVSNPHDYFHAMDVFALLSRDDPFPLACLEAAAMEIPVVCFAQAGGMPELIGDGCGLVAPYLDLEMMARDIVHLGSDHELARGCATRARQKISAECLPDRTGPRLRAVIDHALATGNFSRR